MIRRFGRHCSLCVQGVRRPQRDHPFLNNGSVQFALFIMSSTQSIIIDAGIAASGLTSWLGETVRTGTHLLLLRGGVGDKDVIFSAFAPAALIDRPNKAA